MGIFNDQEFLKKKQDEVQQQNRIIKAEMNETAEQDCHTGLANQLWSHIRFLRSEAVTRRFRKTNCTGNVRV